jgi:hypothetical protein
LSDVVNSVFNIFAATLHIWRPSSIRNLRTRDVVVIWIFKKQDCGGRGGYIELLEDSDKWQALVKK